MSRIIYGVSGEGSGHSSRAREMLTHLIGRGHQVRVLSYDRGYRNLKNDFDVFHITGMHIVSRDNKVAPLRTLMTNLKALPGGNESLAATRELFKSFRPDCVITDFEPMSAYLAAHYDLPLITIDNQHRMRYMKHGRLPRTGKDALVTKTIIKAMVPRPSVSLVTTFYFGEVRNKRTFLFPPILRQAVLDRVSTVEDHVLVYATQSFDTLLALLREFPEQSFRVYGFPGAKSEGNLDMRPFSVAGFLDDLAAASGVIATAGFTLMTEALHFAKPCLALPMSGQFEQMLNGHLLMKLGYGLSTLQPTRPLVADFLERRGQFRERLADYPRSGNDAILAKLDTLLADGERELRAYHAKRRS